MISLFHADCLEKMKDISSNSIDLVICDLPFGCLQARRAQDPEVAPSQGREIVTLPCAWDVKIDLEKFWTEVKRIRRDDHTPCLHFTTTKFGFDLYNSNAKEYRYDLVWNKGRGVSFLSANTMPMRSHEMCYVFSKKGAYYNRVDVSGTPYTSKQTKETVRVYGKRNLVTTTNTGTRCVLSVIEQANTPGKGKHPTEKPIELYKFLIERYCPAGGTVLDPTFGSGNSGRAARDLGRTYIGIEMNKEFYDKAKANLCPEVSTPPIDATTTNEILYP